MAKYTVDYTGQLRTKSVHLKTGDEVITDAPTDNHGKGMTFSPTDLTAVSLATCVMTVMGIKANQMNLPELEMRAEVEKIMVADPRRLGTINIQLHIKQDKLDDKTKTILERTGIECPVAKSLHPDLNQNIEFIYY